VLKVRTFDEFKREQNPNLSDSGIFQVIFSKKAGIGVLHNKTKRI